MAAVGSPHAIHGFAFAGDSGDSWGGWFVAAAGAFAAGTRISAPAGTYTVLGQTTDGLDLGIFGLVDGQVFVEWYHDAQSDRLLPTRLGASVAAGHAGLGSEFDAAWDGAAWDEFGLGGQAQANAGRPNGTRRVDWVFEAFSGDSWTGMLFAEPMQFAPGDILQVPLGRYRITGETLVEPGLAVAAGTVRLSASFFDASSGRFLPLDAGSGASDAGTAGLGSEIGIATLPGGTVSFGLGGQIRAAGPADDLYLISSSGSHLVVWDVNGGRDTIAVTMGAWVRLDLTPGATSVTSVLSFSISADSVIENAVGTNGPDILIGNAADNLFFGWGGNDTILGGAGYDTLILSGRRDDYVVHVWNGLLGVTGRTPTAAQTEGADIASQVERILFTGDQVPFEVGASTLAPLDYIASYGDLMNAFGANADAGFRHLVTAGIWEGRRISFNALDYIASYPDLMNAFGTHAEAGAIHWIHAGRFEGRRTSFDSLSYIASHTDLIQAIGPDATAGARHWVDAGRFEGRGTTFDPLSYLAANPDVLGAFGVDPDAAARHFIQAGIREGRQTNFDGLAYIGSHGDLMDAFGASAARGRQHFLEAGFAEGRQVTFNALDYIASYPDLMNAFSTHAEAGAIHWIHAGRFEGRSVSFDGLTYVNAYPDLLAAFGPDSDAGARHWIMAGRFEERSPTGPATSSADLIG